MFSTLGVLGRANLEGMAGAALLIVDEAAQASEAAMLPALRRVAPVSSLVLVGDPQQLPVCSLPTVCAHCPLCVLIGHCVCTFPTVCAHCRCVCSLPIVCAHCPLLHSVCCSTVLYWRRVCLQCMSQHWRRSCLALRCSATNFDICLCRGGSGNGGVRACPHSEVWQVHDGTADARLQHEVYNA